jgi:hypothetical protein
MKTKYLVLGALAALVVSGFWVGRNIWRVRHGLVTLRVRNAPLAEVLKSVEKQTHKKIRAEQGMDARITLRLTDKPLAYVLDRIAEQAGARWSTLYAVYDSPRAFQALDSALAADGKLDSAGWTRLAPVIPEIKEPAEMHYVPQNGPNPQVQALPPDFAPGRTITATEDVRAGNPMGKALRSPGSMPKMVRVFRGGGPGGGGVEQEVWTPEELVMESGLSSRLGNARPDDASPESAAQTAQKVNGRWTTILALKKSHFGMGFGGPSLQGGPRLGKGPVNGRPGAAGTNFNPGDLPDLPVGDLEAAARHERDEQFARLTPEQRVERARARQAFNQNQ